MSYRDHSLQAGREFLNGQVEQTAEADERDYLIEPPKPDPRCLYGLVGDIARAAANGTEANPYAVAAAALVRLSAAVGPSNCVKVGDVFHRCNLFGMHVGRSSVAGKGEAFALLNRIATHLYERHGDVLGNQYKGSLYTGEGLAVLVHDGMGSGENTVPPIDDKRLFVLQPELDAMLARMRQQGNSLSSELRNAFDGGSIAPATKNNRVSATNPHISLWANITSAELRLSMSAKELSNGFANRFLIIFAERTGLVAIPRGRSDAEVEQLANRVKEVVDFARAGYPSQTKATLMRLSPAAESLYTRVYPKLCRRSGNELIDGLLERRRVFVIRISMLLALLDMSTEIGEQHMDVALAWARFHGESVRFIFGGDAIQRERAEATRTVADKVLEVLQGRHGEWVSRTDLHKGFGHRTPKEMDAALQMLMDDRRIERREVAGRTEGGGRKRTEYRAAQIALIGSAPSFEQNAQAARFAHFAPQNAQIAQTAQLPESAANPHESSNGANSAGVFRANGADDGNDLIEVEV